MVPMEVCLKAISLKQGGALSLLHTTKLRSARQADRESKIEREKVIVLLFSLTAWGRHTTFSS